MGKKFLATSMFVAAFAACVLPATALATNSPELVETPGGATVSVGSTIKVTNVGEATFLDTEGKPKVHCTTAHMTGTLAANSGSAFAVDISTVHFQGTGAVHPHNKTHECTGSFGNSYVTMTTPLCFKSDGALTTREVIYSAGTCAKPTGGIEYTIGSTTTGDCKYKTTTSVKADYTTGAGSTLTTRSTTAGSGASKISGSFLCPTSAVLQFRSALETSNSTPILIE